MIRFALSLVAALVAVATPVYACSCAPTDPKRLAARLEVLFEGRVIDQRRGIDIAGKPAAVVRVRVVRMVKGHRPASGVFTLFSNLSPMACGVDYDPGYTGRFGANMHTGGLYTSSCIQFGLNRGTIGQ